MKRTIFLVALNAVWLVVAVLAPILRAQRQETGLVIQSSKYNPETKNLTLTLVNLSGKDIIAYDMSHSDGSTDYLGRPNPPGEYLEDSLGSELVEAEKLNNPEVAEGNEKVELQNEVANLERIQRPGFLRSVTVLDYLKQYVEDMEKRIALILPHTQIRVLESK